jgi:xylulose-5-phosphate/fructose-6-phosphate phosphoketolase
MRVDAQRAAPPPPEASDPLAALHAYWRAANYLGAAQIYLQANFLLEEPLRPEYIKPRLLGHWGTVPGLNFIYANLNRVIGSRMRAFCSLPAPATARQPTSQPLSGGSLAEFYPEFTPDRDGLAGSSPGSPAT